MLTRSCTGAALLALFVVPFASGCAPRTVIQVPASAAAVRGITVTGVGEAKAPPDIARTNIGVEVRAEYRRPGHGAVEPAHGLDPAGLEAARHRRQGPAHAQLLDRVRAGTGAARAVAAAGRRAAGAAREGCARRARARAGRGARRVPCEQHARSNDPRPDQGRRGAAGATQAGANNVWGISFELEDPKALLAQARIKAVEHAKQNAEALAKLSGVALGPIVSVSEGGGPGVMPPVYAMKSMDSGGGDVPVEHGEVTVSQQVQIVYALPE